MSEPGATKPGGDDAALVRQLDQTLEQAGIFVATEVRDGALILSGAVETEASRQAALDLAAALGEPRGLVVEDALEVLAAAPDLAFTAQDERGGDFAYVNPDRDDDVRLDAGFEGDPDFTDDIGTTDSEEAAAEATPYFPPTDPVVRPAGNDQGLAVVGGFSATAMDEEDDAGEGAAFDDRPDDDLAQAVHRELAEDALTIDLLIRVGARDGVVTLRGTVDTIDDAENAEAVASRVGGVREVIEEIEVLTVPRVPKQ